MRITAPRISYYGWYIVAVAVIAYMVLIGTTYSAFGLYVGPVSAEFGLSRANMNSALILFNIGNAIAAPFVGRMLDRYPVKRVMAGSAIVMGACFIAIGLSHSLWVSGALILLPLAAGIQGAGSMTAGVLVARWFVAQRGRAMAISMIGMAAANILVTPVIAFLIASEGWRSTLVIVGFVLTAILLLATMVVRDRPGPHDIEGGATSPKLALPVEEVEQIAFASSGPMKVGTLLRMPLFWTISLSGALAFGTVQALSISLIPLATDLGFSLGQAAFLMSVIGSMAILGKLTLAVVADRLNRAVLLSICFVMFAVANALLLISHSYELLVICSAIFGLASGISTPIYYALIADRFGAASFGTTRGLMQPISAVFSAGFIRLSGEAYDHMGNYNLLFTGFVIVLIISTFLMIGTRIRPVKIAPAELAV